MNQKNSEVSYFPFMSWMTANLDISGNELILYAFLYNMTINSPSKCYYGSIQHLAEKFNISRQTASAALNRILDKGYILKQDTKKKGCVEYSNWSVSLDKIQLFLPKI